MGVHIVQEKVLAVENWPALTNLAELMSFLWFLKFFSSHLKYYAIVVSPLTKLTQDTPWSWGAKEQATFE